MINHRFTNPPFWWPQHLIVPRATDARPHLICCPTFQHSWGFDYKFTNYMFRKNIDLVWTRNICVYIYIYIYIHIIYMYVCMYIYIYIYIYIMPEGWDSSVSFLKFNVCLEIAVGEVVVKSPYAARHRSGIWESRGMPWPANFGRSLSACARVLFDHRI